MNDSTTALGDGTYEARIRWTTHGVPHITAGDWGSLGFGQGWACAADHLPAIADQILKVRSRRAATFGAGAFGEHVLSDLGYRALDVASRARRMADAQPPEVAAMVEGYAAGITAWWDEVGRDGLPAWCRTASWIGPVAVEDLYATFVDLAAMASGRNLVAYLGAAVPPGADVAALPLATTPVDPGLASNGWAFGGDDTDDGRGVVVANPHFPWAGEGRFWECHLQLPGHLDVYGAALVGAPGVQIGFNRDVAWTHTFSIGHRFTVYRLTLDETDPTRYRWGDEVRAMTDRTVSVDVLGDDGSTSTVERTLWSTHHGPVAALPLLGWSETTAFSVRDANLDNTRVLAQFLANDRATSVHDLRAALRDHQGMPWVNTLAADRHGDSWYADGSTTPALSDTADARFRRAVDEDPLVALAHGMRVAMLDGSDPDDDWVDHAEAPEPGLLPVEAYPEWLGRGTVFNANDPYWVVGPEVTLPRHGVLHGLWGRPLSGRSRVNGLTLAGELPGGVARGEWTGETARGALLAHRSLHAELLLDPILDRLVGAGRHPVGDREVDLDAARQVLASWDRTFGLDSPGAVLWREFLAGFSDAELRDAGRLYAEPFDPADPLHTPRGLAAAPATGPDPLAVALAEAVDGLRRAGLAADVTLRACQGVRRGNQLHPLPGGGEIEGVADVVTPAGNLPRVDLMPRDVEAEPVAGRTERTGLRMGGYGVTYGVSFVMVVDFGDDGPVADALLVYGQSPDPDAVHHSDQLSPFAEGTLRRVAFTDDAIDADPDLVERTVGTRP